MENEFVINIGLELHAQLLTKSKLFCHCSSEFGSIPNTNTCPTCLGLPGALPVLNKKAIEYAIKMGLATNCSVNSNTYFARKNYFYPDLPKGYQISQYNYPVCENGFIEIKSRDNTTKKIPIIRIHLEEDAGKSIHTDQETQIDLNRSGIPLIEIVTAPHLESPEEAHIYMKQIRQYLRYIGISSGNMEEGSLRCDANISLRQKSDGKMGIRTEIKNLNSFRHVEHALRFEIQRQLRKLSNNQKIQQETMLWDDSRSVTVPIRMKEAIDDYRYFPEPDLVKYVITKAEIQEIQNSLPELPEKKMERFIKEFRIPEYDAKVLTEDADMAIYFEEASNYCEDRKLLSNWIMTELLYRLKENKDEIKHFSISPNRLGKLCSMISSGVISGKIAKRVFSDMMTDSASPEDIVARNSWQQITNEKLLTDLVRNMLHHSPAQVEEYRLGKRKVFEYLVGKIMSETRGNAAPELLKKILRKELDNL